MGNGPQCKEIVNCKFFQTSHVTYLQDNILNTESQQTNELQFNEICFKATLL